MILKEEKMIIKAFLKEPWSKLTYADIKRISEKRSKSYVYGVLKKLIKDNIILCEKIGKSIIYSLNIDSLRNKSFAGFVHEDLSWNLKHVPTEVIERLSKKIPSTFFILIVTGSYAKNKQNKNSDLDVVIICDNFFEPKKIYASLNLESELSIPKVHLYVFTKDDFIKMLLNDKENYGKEIARNNLIFYGGEVYYEIMREAIKNGYRG